MKAEDVFQDYLEKGESILWIGRPGPGRTYGPSDARRAFYFSALTLLLIAIGAYFGPRVAAMSLAGAIVLGAALIVAETIFFAAHIRPIGRAMRRRAAMLYCLTNERALIVEAALPRRWAWVRIADDTPIAVTELGGGRATISIGRRYDFDTEDFPLFRGFTFYNIKDGDVVRRKIERLQDDFHVNRAPGAKRLSSGGRGAP